MQKLYFPPYTGNIFLSVAELDYGNSYEIEYMEKIGSSVPVSFHVWISTSIYFQAVVIMNWCGNAIWTIPSYTLN